MKPRSVMTTTTAWLGLAGPALATGSLDRLRAVSRHAQDKAGATPAHLWVGLTLGAFVLVLVAGAAYWTFRREKA